MVFKAVRRRAAAALALDVLTVFFVACCVARFFAVGGEGNMQVVGWTAFRYFTVDSNVLAALASAASVPVSLRALFAGEERMPRALLLFRFVGTAAVAVTFFTVLIFLGPIYGYPMMYAGSNLFLHLLCPLFFFLSFLFFTGRGERLPLRLFWLGVLPVVLYGAVYLYCVLIRGNWPDFYVFNSDGRWYVSLVVMLSATALLSVLFLFLFSRIREREK